MKLGITLVAIITITISDSSGCLAANWYPLPDTGQTKCYDNNDNITPCPAIGHPGHGQDAQYVGLTPSYTDNANGTVTDNNTNLIWQQNTADANKDGSITFNLFPTGDMLTWQDAIDYCENLTFADSSDWRLPSMRELDSIFDYSRYSQRVSSVFKYELVSWHWSSTTYIHSSGDTGSAWGVMLNDNRTDIQAPGGEMIGGKEGANVFFCVRDGL